MTQKGTIPPMGKATLAHIRVMVDNIEQAYRSAYSTMLEGDEKYVESRLEALHTLCERVEKTFIIAKQVQDEKCKVGYVVDGAG